jgi:amino acid adenylation domain-containing protein
VRAVLIESYENQEYPVERLVEKVCPTRDLSRNPLFDTCFVLQNMDISLMKAENLYITPRAIDTGTTTFDLTLEAVVTADGIRIEAEYSTDLFTANTMNRFLSHFQNILRAVLLDDNIAIGKIPLLSEREKSSLIAGFSDTDASWPESATIDSIFDTCASSFPERTALSIGDRSMTYKELGEKSDVFAAMLLERGVKADDIVAISLVPSFEMIVGILGILKAGAAYLPIDPDSPEERTAYLLEDSRAKVFLAAGPFPDRFTAVTECIRPEDLDEQGHVSNIRRGEHASGNLAYIIYTSGSTGKPKGVMIEHRNVVRLLFNSRFPFDFSENDVWTLFHSFCFDFSVWEMYGALLRGGRLVLVPKTGTRDTRAFIDLLIREKATVLNQTPAAFYNLIDEESLKEPCLSLRYVIFGGDALRPSLLKPFRDRYPDTKLINMYGITETTVHVTVKEIGDREIQSNTGNIGVPIPTLKTFVVDKELNLVPVGVPGELCVSGAGLGRGYLNNPELTKVKFCPNPFVETERMYRSGDLARVLESGDLEYLGRIDNQLKIRGYRVELGEIESELLKHTSIREVFVYPRADRFGEKQLYAYFTSEDDLGYEELKSFLSVSLPSYMIPAYFIRLAEIPLNRNGKIDKGLLPGIEEAIRPERRYSAPVNDTEKLLYALWSDVLETEEIGLDDDFFAIGGESLKAVKFISRLPDNGHVITLVDLYKNPTIRELAALRDSGEEQESSVLVRLSSGNPAGKTPVICFPYGGGTVLSYRDLSGEARLLLPEYSLYAVNLSGHDMNTAPVFLSSEETAKAVFDELIRMNPKEAVLYGHCVGCAPMLALAYLLEKTPIKIAGIFAGGTYPPGYVGLYGGFFDPWMFSSDKQILDYLARIGLPKHSTDAESLAFVIQSFRHDARTYYRYLHSLRKNASPRLATAIHFIAGSEDRVTNRYSKSYRNWLRYSKHVSLHVIMNAEHYFINTHPEELARIMAELLAEEER